MFFPFNVLLTMLSLHHLTSRGKNNQINPFLNGLLVFRVFASSGNHLLFVSMANFEHAEDEQKHVKMPGETPTVCAPGLPDQVSPAPAGIAEAATCVIPSFAAASELLSAPYSCLVMSTRRRHVALPPVYLNKKKTGIQEELDTELLRFSHRYQHKIAFSVCLCAELKNTDHIHTRLRVTMVTDDNNKFIVCHLTMKLSYD